MQRPICILATPRSGSSMVAGIFASHGVWTGTCREASTWNPKGFFENKKLKTILMEMWPGFIADGMLATPKEGFRDAIETAVVDDGYKGGPWLMKHSALYWRAWSEMKPKWVCVRRNAEEIFKSCRKSGFLAPRREDDHLRRVIALHDEQMDEVVEMHGGINVFTCEVVSGNSQSLKDAIEYCGIEYNPKAVDDFVEPQYWHA